jgi:hypothetical protein
MNPTPLFYGRHETFETVSSKCKSVRTASTSLWEIYNVIYNVSDRWVSVSHLDIIFGFFLKGDRWSSAGSTFGCTNFESRLGNTLVMF